MGRKIIWNEDRDAKNKLAESIATPKITTVIQAALARCKYCNEEIYCRMAGGPWYHMVTGSMECNR